MAVLLTISLRNNGQRRFAKPRIDAAPGRSIPSRLAPHRSYFHRGSHRRARSASPRAVEFGVRPLGRPKSDRIFPGRPKGRTPNSGINLRRLPLGFATASPSRPVFAIVSPLRSTPYHWGVRTWQRVFAQSRPRRGALHRHLGTDRAGLRSKDPLACADSGRPPPQRSSTPPHCKSVWSPAFRPSEIRSHFPRTA